jgi:hypothetical protein
LDTNTYRVIKLKLANDVDTNNILFIMDRLAMNGVSHLIVGKERTMILLLVIEEIV